MKIKVKNIRGIIILTICFVMCISGILIYKEHKRELETMANEKKLPLHSVSSENKEVAISFDVNWAEKDYLNDILDILDKYDIKSTFFVMGKWLEYTDENKEKLKAINERGHEVGNHSYIHPNFSSISEDKMEKEIKKTEEIIYETIGVKTNLFRFPSGDYSEKAVNKVNKMGYIPIQWDVDSVDWRQDGKEKEYKRVRDKVKGGSIILYHNNAKYTPENLERVIKELKEEGYEFKKVGEMIYKDNYYIDSEGIQHKKL